LGTLKKSCDFRPLCYLDVPPPTRASSWKTGQERVILVTTARVTIENFWARRERDAGETLARTFTNFNVGTVYFRHMGVQVSRICTIFYGERSVLKIFASFTVITYVSNMYERIYLDQS
jgi:hypothetical protein